MCHFFLYSPDEAPCGVLFFVPASSVGKVDQFARLVSTTGLGLHDGLVGQCNEKYVLYFVQDTYSPGSKTVPEPTMDEQIAR